MSVGGRILLNGHGVWTGFFGLRTPSLVGSSENGNELSDHVKDWKFID
jgi:hypothetical protein